MGLKDKVKKSLMTGIAAGMMLTPSVEADAQDSDVSSPKTEQETVETSPDEEEGVTYEEIKEDSVETKDEPSSFSLGVAPQIQRGYAYDGLRYDLGNNTLSGIVDVIATKEVGDTDFSAIFRNTENYDPTTNTHNHIEKGVFTTATHDLTERVSVKAGVSGFDLGDIFGGYKAAQGNIGATASVTDDTDVSMKYVEGLHNIDGRLATLDVSKSMEILDQDVNIKGSARASNDYFGQQGTGLTSVGIEGKTGFTIDDVAVTLKAGYEKNVQDLEGTDPWYEGPHASVSAYIPLN